MEVARRPALFPRSIMPVIIVIASAAHSSHFSHESELLIPLSIYALFRPHALSFSDIQHSSASLIIAITWSGK
jgi:hypothetical protein